ncbi:MAG: hypothetical protein GC204_20225 [Chloroflexi bacterium]|nr:hypothetical protein [Chloroflexota bacterium]
MSELNINLDATVEFLVGLLKTPSPTGYHVEASHVYERRHKDSIRDTTHLIARYLLDDRE